MRLSRRAVLPASGGALLLTACGHGLDGGPRRRAGFLGGRALSGKRDPYRVFVFFAAAQTKRQHGAKKLLTNGLHFDVCPELVACHQGGSLRVKKRAMHTAERDLRRPSLASVPSNQGPPNIACAHLPNQEDSTRAIKRRDRGSMSVGASTSS